MATWQNKHFNMPALSLNLHDHLHLVGEEAHENFSALQ
jgi:hypothetical protein